MRIPLVGVGGGDNFVTNHLVGVSRSSRERRRTSIHRGAGERNGLLILVTGGGTGIGAGIAAGVARVGGG